MFEILNPILIVVALAAAIGYVIIKLSPLFFSSADRFLADAPTHGTLTKYANAGR
jgi:hypothetical protein